MSTIKQPRNTGMCAVCVAAMATGTTTDEVYAWLADGREHGDPMHDPEVAAYLLRHGWLMGRGWMVNTQDSGTDVHLSGPESLELILNGIAGERAFLGVKSRNHPGLGHAVFWDGQVVRDPDPSMPDESVLADYSLLDVFPLIWLGADYTCRLEMKTQAEPPSFVTRWRRAREVHGTEWGAAIVAEISTERSEG